jgi:hypothetical protein
MYITSLIYNLLSYCVFKLFNALKTKTFMLHTKKKLFTKRPLASQEGIYCYLFSSIVWS